MDGSQLLPSLHLIVGGVRTMIQSVELRSKTFVGVDLKVYNGFHNSKTMKGPRQREASQPATDLN